MKEEISFPRTVFLSLSPFGFWLIFFSPFGFFFIPFPYPSRTLCRFGPAISAEPINPDLSEVPVIRSS